jgi:hypothetical protein
MSTAEQFMGGKIKSIQRGVFSITGTNSTASVTISAVDTSKAILTSLGSSGNGGASDASTLCYLELVDATTVRATRNQSAVSGTSRISYQVVEYY